MKEETKRKIAKANTGKRKNKKDPKPECCRCHCSWECKEGDQEAFLKCKCNLHSVKHKETK